jgi:thioredoxin-related protein
MEISNFTIKYEHMRLFICLLFAGVLGTAFTTVEQSDATVEESINWMSWEEALEANKENPKKIFVDVYTKWCGWCKKMDKTTFLDQDIIKELNENFYAVKFDAEQKTPINFNGSEFIFVNEGRRGVHQLAYALLDGRLGYPAFVLLDESFSRIMISPGYKQVDQLLKELNFASKEAYKNQSWEEFSRAE